MAIFARIDHAAGAAQVGLPLRATKLHRHNANAFIYVLEGSVIMQSRSEPVTLHPGRTFYEGPDDIHVVGRNASKRIPRSFSSSSLRTRVRPS
jgi:quercetin dioxygenase-like cupin family protein